MADLVGEAGALAVGAAPLSARRSAAPDPSRPRTESRVPTRPAIPSRTAWPARTVPPLPNPPRTADRADFRSRATAFTNCP